MSIAHVNVFSDLLLELPKEDMYVVFCTQQNADGTYRILSYKSELPWSHVDPTCQPVIDPNTLYTESSVRDMIMADRPMKVKGYTYIMLIRCEFTMSQQNRTALLNGIIEKHDRLVRVEPQKDIVAILAEVADDVYQIGIHYTINFKHVRYTMKAYRIGRGEEVARDLVLDPLGFEAAIKAYGWCMCDAPAHTARQSQYIDDEGIPYFLHDVYYALLIRAEGHSGPTFLISSATDVQDYRRRKEGIAAHFKSQIAGS